MLARLRHNAAALVGLALFGIALAVLRVELRAVTWSALIGDIGRIPTTRLALALVLTALNYAVLTTYDLLGLAYARAALPRARVMAASFLAYAVSNNVGFAMLSGASVRYRFYTRWGLSGEQLSRLVLAYTATFWLGLFALGGLSLAAGAMPAVVPAALVVAVRPIGWLLMLVPVAYLAATAVFRRPIRLHRLQLAFPAPDIAVKQVIASTVDWLLAAAVLYVLLPQHAPGLLTFLGLYFAAMLLGMASHVPGGVGVFEGLLVLLLRPYLTSGELLPSLVVYRLVYYVAPLVLAVMGLAADEVWLRRAYVKRARTAAGRLAEQWTPQALAALTFIAGVVLLFSGATPAAAGRLEILRTIVPLGIIEASHFLASVAGAALLVLSQGLARRLDAAYALTSATLVAAMAASLLKGVDYEEATVVMLVLLVLWRARPAFDRRAAFFETRFSASWLAAVGGALAASVWLGFFAFKHVAYANELWWQFELRGEASRFLRASVGAAMVFLLVPLARLIGFAPHEAPLPTAQDLDDARRVIAAQSSTLPCLAFLGDKALLFNDERTGFVMYGVKGRTWVALGDPVGPPEALPTLVRLFLERCADFGGVPVFYEVSRHHMHVYADFGLTFVKLGEEARVDLGRFTLEGGHAARYRQVLKRLDKDGGSFRIVTADEVPAAMAQLRAVSDDWLQAKAGAEKGFSLGFFDEHYLSRFPVAVIERNSRIEAFANLLLAADRSEMSVDLMRYHHEAPKNVMEALLVHVMLWGREQGYRWFALGMAPLSGFESPPGSLWTRLGAFLYHHGDAVYNFQGLRVYKEKFAPCWEPRYLAYPGGLRLPRIMAGVSALVAGGYRQIFARS